MKHIPAGAFKARCLAVMKKVQATGEPIIVTKRGTPVVKVAPAQSEKNDIFGFMMGKVKIVGDIESQSLLSGRARQSDPARPARARLARHGTHKYQLGSLGMNLRRRS
jgi:prevent-host-death family protein